MSAERVAMVRLSRRLVEAFAEEDHPRDDSGKFTSGGGGARSTWMDEPKAEKFGPRSIRLRRHGNDQYSIDVKRGGKWGPHTDDTPMPWKKAIQLKGRLTRNPDPK